MPQLQRLINPLTGKHYGSVLEMAPAVRKTTVMFNKSSWRGECGLCNDGMCLRFQFFCMGCCGEDDWVVDVAEIPVPTVIDKLFFDKVARLICMPVIATLSIPWSHLIGIGLVFIRIFFFQIECTSNWLCN